MPSIRELFYQRYSRALRINVYTKGMRTEKLTQFFTMDAWRCLILSTLFLRFLRSSPRSIPVPLFVYLLFTFHCFATCPRRIQSYTTFQDSQSLVTSATNNTGKHQRRRGNLKRYALPARTHCETRHGHDCFTPHYGSAATIAALSHIAARARTKWWG